MLTLLGYGQKAIMVVKVFMEIKTTWVRLVNDHGKGYNTWMPPIFTLYVKMLSHTFKMTNHLKISACTNIHPMGMFWRGEQSRLEPCNA